MERPLVYGAQDLRLIKAAVGALAICSAAVAGVGATMIAPLFGALTALALSAGAGLAGAIQWRDGDRYHGWRTMAWVVLALGWIALAILLLGQPREQLGVMRLLCSAMLVGTGALRAWRCQADGGCTLPGMVVAFLFTVLALAVLWSGEGLPMYAPAAAATSMACALELFGTGSFWLAAALITMRAPLAGRAPVGGGGQAALQTA